MMKVAFLCLVFYFLTLSDLTAGQYWSPYDHLPSLGQAYPSGGPHGGISPSARSSAPGNPYYPQLFGSSGEQFGPVASDSLHAFPPSHRVGCSAAMPPKIDWGDCPSLESKEEDKKMKEEKQKDCMKNLELNENTTYAELSPVLQNRVRECTLRKDELLNEAGKYNYDKAVEKLKSKGLPENLNKKVEEAHIECKIEAEQKFRSSATSLAEVDSYNECMDFHLAMLCKIKVMKNTEKVTNANSFHGVLPMPYASPANTHSHNFGDVMNKIQILSQALRR